MSLLMLALSLIFLLGIITLTGISTSLQTLGRLQAREEFKKHHRIFFFQHITSSLFKEKNWDGLFFCLSFTKQALQLCYAISAFFFVLGFPPFQQAIAVLPDGSYALTAVWSIFVAAIVVLSSLTMDLGARLFATAKPSLVFLIFGWIASVFLLLLSPLSSLSLKIFKKLFPSIYRHHNTSPTMRIRDKILEIIHESELAPHLDPQEQKLIASVASFKERIAREIMVPRIDVFSLPATTSIAEAAQSFVLEGYSRIPVYRDSVDHIIGVLLYKDVLNIYARDAMHKEETSSNLSKAIEGLVKPVLYTPETKKISHLLQEFRSKQIHLAIVVDEYGGTEGIVTIEDILEELVGEIADEYDIDQEVMYSILPGGGWTVDARMGILDIDKELGIKIPSSPEYDTIGGYIFHRAGAIPSKGWRIHHDDFDLEVLSSDERSIEKIRITPHHA